MDFRYTSEQEAFRVRLREWLERNKAEVFGHDSDPTADRDEDSGTRWQKTLQWHRRLYEAGYIALHWPKEWGGGGASLVEQAIYQDEVLRLGLPLYGANQLALDRIGPTLMFLGTEEQRQRFLPKMLTAEEIWCQGYSEPGAGSDLAGLQTRAVIDGDDFVINGQKVWTSLAHRAHWQVLLVRTDPNAPKHRGISYLLVDMRAPGITIRPLVQITGDSDFNEVFYDNVRVPRKNLVGEINQGWQVSIATLMYERVSGGTRHPVERTINELVELARTTAFEGMLAAKHPYVRQRLAQFASEALCLRLSRYRSLTSQLNGKVPGPESSYGKLHATALALSSVACPWAHHRRWLKRNSAQHYW
jgi:alkylation response protein AidB-like acyl-CoA dehydrogenase